MTARHVLAITVALLAPCAALLAPGAAHAGDPTPAPVFERAQGWRLRAGVGEAFLTGHFDDRTVLNGPGFALAMPKAQVGFGPAIAAGHDQGGLAFELRWQRTEHDVTVFGGTPSTAQLEQWSLEAMGCGQNRRRLQACGIFGMGMAGLGVRKGAVNAEGKVGTAKYAWLFWSFGISTELYLTRRLSLQARGLYEIMWVADARAFGRRRWNVDEKDFRSDVLSLDTTVAYVF